MAVARTAYDEAMGEAVTGLLLWGIGLAVLYWVIRLAVSHGIGDAEQWRHRRGDR